MTTVLAFVAGSVATVVVGFLVGAWVAGYRPTIRGRMVRRDGEWVTEDRCRDLSCTCNLDRTP